MLQLNTISGNTVRISVVRFISIDTEILTVLPKKVKKNNLIITSSRITTSNVFTILDIFNELNFNDQLEAIQMLSKYILARKPRKYKGKRRNS